MAKNWEKILSKTSTELLHALKNQQAEITRSISARQDEFRKAIDQRLEFFRGLRGPSSYIILDRPVLILEHPKHMPDVFRDSHIDPGNNWVKFLVKEWVHDSLFVETSFLFYFMWTNESQDTKVINVSSSLIFSGTHCYVFANPGGLTTWFSVGRSSLWISAILSLLRWTGWKPLPDGTPVAGTYDLNTQQSQYQSVVDLDAYAQGLGTTYKSSPPFVMVPYHLGYNLFAIPPNATTIFQIEVAVTYALKNRYSQVFGDFAESDNRVLCPWVQLEVLDSSF